MAGGLRWGRVGCSKRGAVEGRDGWQWRTHSTAGSEESRRLGGRTVVLEVYAPGDGGGGGSWAAARVELMLPQEDPP